MKVDISKHLHAGRDFVGWFLIRAITKLGSLGDKSEQAKKLLERDEDNNVDVSLLFNGVELPVVETILDMEKQFDEEVKTVANELIKDRLQGNMEKAEVVVENIVGELRDVLSGVRAKKIDGEVTCDLDMDDQTKFFVYASGIDDDTPCLLIEYITENGCSVTFRIADDNVMENIGNVIKMVREERDAN